MLTYLWQVTRKQQQQIGRVFSGKIGRYVVPIGDPRSGNYAEFRSADCGNPDDPQAPVGQFYLFYKIEAPSLERRITGADAREHMVIRNLPLPEMVTFRNGEVTLLIKQEN